MANQLTDEERERNNIIESWFNSSEVKKSLEIVGRHCRMFEECQLLDDIKQHAFLMILEMPLAKIRKLQHTGMWSKYVYGIIDGAKHKTSGFRRRNLIETEQEVEWVDYLHDECFEIPFDSPAETKEELLHASLEELNRLPYIDREVVKLYSKHEQETAALYEIRERGVSMQYRQFHSRLQAARELIQDRLLSRGIILKKVPFLIKSCQGLSVDPKFKERRIAKSIQRLIDLWPTPFSKDWTGIEKVSFILLHHGYSSTVKKIWDCLFDIYDDSEIDRSVAPGAYLKKLIDTGIVIKRYAGNLRTVQYEISPIVVEYFEKVVVGRSVENQLLCWRIFVKRHTSRWSFQRIENNFGCSKGEVEAFYRIALSVVNGVIEAQKEYLIKYASVKKGGNAKSVLRLNSLASLECLL